MGTTSVKNDIENERVKWFRDLIGTNPEQSTAGACSSKTSGHMAQGQPRKKWIDWAKDTKEHVSRPHLVLDQCLKLPATIMT